MISNTIAKCREDKLLAEQRKQRIQADKTLRWINLLTGKQPMTAETFDVLKNQGYPIGEKITLIHMETQGDFFLLQSRRLWIVSRTTYKADMFM